MADRLDALSGCSLCTMLASGREESWEGREVGGEGGGVCVCV